jgi:hypothetical protein
MKLVFSSFAFTLTTLLATNKLLCFRRVRSILKTTISPSSTLYVHLSVRTKQLGSRWTDFDEILYLDSFSKIYRENLSRIIIRQE